MIELRAVSKDNLDEILSLDILEHQKAFVSSTACALAQAYVYRETAFPFAVYANDTLVGFIMMGYYEARKQYTLWKFLIDMKHQNKGYGREALLQGMAYLKENFGAKEIYTGITAGNAQAKHLYRAVGFRETGLVENKVEEMKIVL